MTNVGETCKYSVLRDSVAVYCGKPACYANLCDGHRDETIKEHRAKIHRHYADIDALTVKLRALGAST
jgi:hypothetical protein